MNPHNDLHQLPPIERHHHFINTLAKTGELWTIIDADGTFALFEVENNTVISFWPDESSIESNLSVDWQNYIPFKINLNDLEETIIPIIRQKNYLINVYPVDARTGYIITLSDFVNDLNNQQESTQ